MDDGTRRYINSGLRDGIGAFKFSFVFMILGGGDTHKIAGLKIYPKCGVMLCYLK